MVNPIVVLSIPALREQDLQNMPRLSALMRQGEHAELVPSFPAVTWPVQANLVTGCSPQEHGVVANGFYWRDRREVEMWTATNDKLLKPQIWDTLRVHDANLTSAVWFPMLSKQCSADYVCMPAPIHNPDGSESLWCYTKPTELYGELRDSFGHFPLQHFWGPMFNIKANTWIVDSAIYGAQQYRPNFFFLYLTHLDYAAQKTGPDSEQAVTAVQELDHEIGRLIDGFSEAYAENVIWIAASEYVITEVDHVAYPNRQLREAGLLQVQDGDEGEQLDLEKSRAWAMVDHQFSHVFVADRDETTIRQVCELFSSSDGIADTASGTKREAYNLNHERAGDVILISEPNSWQAYYWWFDDTRAPTFAHTVDIHRKPGYDPVELHLDMATKSIPLDATLVKGSHGAPAVNASQRGVALASQDGILGADSLADTDVAQIVLKHFGAY